MKAPSWELGLFVLPFVPRVLRPRKKMGNMANENRWRNASGRDKADNGGCRRHFFFLFFCHLYGPKTKDSIRFSARPTWFTSRKFNRQILARCGGGWGI